MLTENLSDLPLHQEIREAMRKMISAGNDPLDVAEAALSVAGALAVSVEGQARTGSKLYAAGAALLNAADDQRTAH
jgi:hypothetical protein